MNATSTTSPAAETRLTVKNLTRRTVLATRLEVAVTGPKRNKGLLGRSGLETGGGLWICLLYTSRCV